MTLLTPTQAPLVHLEPLPACKDGAVMATTKGTKLTITVWPGNGSDLSCVSGSLDSFVERYCYDCQYHTEEMEWEAGNGNYEVYINGEDRYLTGTFYTESPCGAYNNGIGDISWPCYAGHEPEGDEETLDGTHMAYSNELDFSCLPMDQNLTYAFQQAMYVSDGIVYVGGREASINTFANNDICWGNNSIPPDLLQIANLFSRSEGNDDLTSPSTHQENAAECENSYDDMVVDTDNGSPLPRALPISSNEQGLALVCATAVAHTSAYLLLGSSGTAINEGVAYVPVRHYSNVGVTDDIVCNVWASDVLRCGKRLLFVEDREHNSKLMSAQFIGQVNPDFNLEPCKSTKQLLSESEAQDNNCCPH